MAILCYYISSTPKAVTTHKTEEMVFTGAVLSIYNYHSILILYYILLINICYINLKINIIFLKTSRNDKIDYSTNCIWDG